MKKTLSRIGIFVSVLLILSTTCFATNISKIAVVQTSLNTYVIYPNEPITSEFQYAYSNTNISPTLIYDVSSKDGANNNVAVISATDYATYFEGIGETYIYIKNGENISNVKIDLNSAINVDKVNSISDLSKRINVSMGTETIDVMEDDVAKKITQGIVMVYNEAGATFGYNLEKVTGNAILENFIEKYEALDNLTNESSMYTKLTTLKSMYDAYNTKLADISFTDIENETIKQPVDAQNGEVYLLWLKKDVTGQDSIYDMRLLNSIRNVETGENKITEEVKVEKLVKLPVTFDNQTIIYIMLAIIAVLSILVIVKISLEKKNNNTRK